jgi:hypothetical protein
MYYRLLKIYLGPLWRRTALLGGLLVLGVGPSYSTWSCAPSSIRKLAARLRPCCRRDVYIGIAILTIVAVTDTYPESVGQEATNALRADLIARGLNLDMPFHDARTPGEMIERVDGDVAALANLFPLRALTASALMLIGVLVRYTARLAHRRRLHRAQRGRAVMELVRDKVPATCAHRQSSAELIGFLEEWLSACRTRERRCWPSSTVLSSGCACSGPCVWRPDDDVLGSVDRRCRNRHIAVFGLGVYFYRAGSMTLGTVFLMFQYVHAAPPPWSDQRQARFPEREREHRARSQLLDTTTGLVTVGVSGSPRTAGFGSMASRSRTVSSRCCACHRLAQVGCSSAGPHRQRKTIARLLLRPMTPRPALPRLGDGRTVDARDAALDECIAASDGHAGGALFRATARQPDAARSVDPDQRGLRRSIDSGLGLVSAPTAHRSGVRWTPARGGGASLSAGGRSYWRSRAFLRDPGPVILDEASSRDLSARAARAPFTAWPGGRRCRIASRNVEACRRHRTIEDGRIVEHGPRATSRPIRNSRAADMARSPSWRAGGLE